MTKRELKHIQRMIAHANKRNTQDYSCPVCGEDVTVHVHHHGILECTGCLTRLKVDRNGEFERGMWHDRTRLIPV